MKKILFAFGFLTYFFSCLTAQEDTKLGYSKMKILHNDTLLPGFYTTHDDFVNNSPSTNGFRFDNDIYIFWEENLMFPNQQKLYVSYGYSKENKSRVRVNRDITRTI